MLTKIVALNTIIDNYKNKFGDEHYERMKSLMENLYIDVLKHIDSFDELLNAYKFELERQSSYDFNIEQKSDTRTYILQSESS